MWLEVFESNQEKKEGQDSPEDPSCLAGLASLEVQAVPGEKQYSVSVVF